MLLLFNPLVIIVQIFLYRSMTTFLRPNSWYYIGIYEMALRVLDDNTSFCSTDSMIGCSIFFTVIF